MVFFDTEKHSERNTMEIYLGQGDKTVTINVHDVLKVSSCGIQKAKTPYKLVREKGRKDYHIVYVKNGNPEFVHEGTVYILRKGDFVLYKPFQRQEYTYYAGTETDWIHFYGNMTETLLSALGLSSGVYRCEEDPAIPALFSRLMDDTEISHHHDRIIPSLISFISALAGNLRFDGANNGYERLQAALYRMNVTFTENIDLAEYAALCNLSQSRFVHLFKQYVGDSPYRYQMRKRMEKAKELLRYSSLQIGEISTELGFQDSLYFSRLFKKHTGASPREYRNMKRL